MECFLDSGFRRNDVGAGVRWEAGVTVGGRSDEVRRNDSCSTMTPEVIERIRLLPPATGQTPARLSRRLLHALAPLQLLAPAEAAVSGADLLHSFDR